VEVQLEYDSTRAIPPVPLLEWIVTCSLVLIFRDNDGNHHGFVTTSLLTRPCSFTYPPLSSVLPCILTMMNAILHRNLAFAVNNDRTKL